MLGKLYKWRWAVLSLIFWAMVLVHIPVDFLDLGGDSAQYIILAESLSQGTGYRALNYPGQPFFYHYPPIFPLLLTPFLYLFGRNLFLLHLLIAFFGYLSLFAFYRLFKKYSDERFAFLLTVFLAVSVPFLINSSKYILSDMPYLFLTGLTLLAASRYSVQDEVLTKEGWLTLLGLLLGYFTRYVGITLFLGLVLAVLLMPRKGRLAKAAFLCGGFLLLVFLWQITARILNPSSIAVYYSSQFLPLDPYRPFLGTIFDQPQQLFIRFFEGAGYYYRMVAVTIFPYFAKRGGFCLEFFALFTIIMIFSGLGVKFRQDKRGVFSYYFLTYFLLLALWPFGRGNFRESMRFLLPIMPLVIFYFFLGLRRVISFLPQAGPRRTAYIFICLLLIFNVFFGVFSIPRGAIMRADKVIAVRNFVALHRWILENLPSAGVILSRTPPATYFYTNHQAIGYPFVSDPQEIWQEISKNKVRYIVVDEIGGSTPLYLHPVILKYQDRLKFLRRVGRTDLFEITPSFSQPDRPDWQN